MISFIPTPIGNLWDITVRSLDLLKNLQYLVCEDPSSTRKLLRHYEVELSGKKFLRLTSFTTDRQMMELVQLGRQQEIGVVSDAGTPGLSDPGKWLIKLCREHQIPFSVLPWANALTPTTVAMPCDTSEFVFIGFLPKKKGKQTALQSIIQSSVPVILYESVHRVLKTCEELKRLGYIHNIFIARELSKLHEQYAAWSIDDIITRLQDGSIPLKGEFVMGCYH